MSHHLNLTSVIIPVFNGESFIRQAVESIFSQAQGSFEIIIVDDGSSDRTAEIVQLLTPPDSATTIHYVFQTNQGPAAARNVGIRMGCGEFLAFLDADDIWVHNKISLQQRAFEGTSSEIFFVWGYLQQFEICDGIKIEHGNPHHEHNLGSILFRATAFEKNGLFDESLRWGEDHDWLIRAKENKLGHMLQSETVLFYRRHANNSWLGQPGAERALLDVVRRRLLRSRVPMAGTPE